MDGGEQNMMFVDMIGWMGTILMFGGSVVNIYKHKACWVLWIIGGFMIIYQSFIIFNWNILVLQALYQPLNMWGWLQWRQDNENS